MAFAALALSLIVSVIVIEVADTAVFVVVNQCTTQLREVGGCRKCAPLVDKCTIKGDCLEEYLALGAGLRCPVN
jgi:hypothetical protein